MSAPISTSATSFRDAILHEDWIFDFFAKGFEFLSRCFDPTRTEANEGAWEEQREKAARLNLGQTIVKADGDIPPLLLEYLAPPSTRQGLAGEPFLLRLFCTLSAIDEAAESLNIHGTAYAPAGTWSRVRVFQREHLWRLNSDPRRIVLSKAAKLFPPQLGGPDPWWAIAKELGQLEEPPPRGTHLPEYFQNLCTFGEPTEFTLSYHVLPRWQDLDGAVWQTLRVGFVPLIDSLEIQAPVGHLKPGPLEIRAGSAPRTFTVIAAAPAPPECLDLSDLAERAIRWLAAQKAQIVVFPEAVVPDPVVRRIGDTLKDLAAAGSPYPQLVLAGSYNRTRPDGDAPHNQAVVLNGRGQELWRQNKLHHYEMAKYEQRLYGLDVLFPDADGVREEITTAPREITVCDSPATGLRMVVLICEDGVQEAPAGELVRSVRANLIFNPVMAGALLKTREFVKTAGKRAFDPGSATIVVNSAALPNAEWRRRKPGKSPIHPPLGVVALPLAGTENHSPVHLLWRRKAVSGGGEVLLFQCPHK